MDDQVDKVLEELVNQALNGPGFLINSGTEKATLKRQLTDYFAELIFEILMQHLTDEQIAMLEEKPNLETPETQAQIAQMAGAIPGFNIILKDKLEKEANEIGRSGKIPEIPK